MAGTNTPPRVLLVGGHGKVATHMIPLMLSRNWHVLPVIRNEKHQDDILTVTYEALEGRVPASSASNISNTSWKESLDIVVYDIEAIKSPSDAEKLLKLARPDWVVFCAGAGDANNYERTCAVDRDAACHIMSASIQTLSITKIFVLSGLTCRHIRPSWWSDEDWDWYCRWTFKELPQWTKIKHSADEWITVKAAERYEREKTDVDKNGFVKGEDGDKREVFTYIIFRPGLYVDGPPAEKVSLGKTKCIGTITRQSVAHVAVALLGNKGVRGWVDCIQDPEREQEIEKEVHRLVASGEDAIEGEDWEGIKLRVQKMQEDLYLG